MNETPMPPPEPGDMKGLQRQSPWIMLISLVMLITGLLLTSFMMLYYAWQHTGKSTLESFNLSAWKQKRPAVLLPALKPEPQQIVQKAERAAAPAAPAPQPHRESIKWPKIRLSGFGMSADGESGFAILNGKQVLKGETSGKIRLVNVQTHAIVVEYMGEQRTFSMGIED